MELNQRFVQMENNLKDNEFRKKLQPHITSLIRGIEVVTDDNTFTTHLTNGKSISHCMDK